MDVELLKRVIRDQEDELRQKVKTVRLVQRVYLKELSKALSHANALVLTGIRRSGKSMSAILLTGGRQYVYLNFDDPSLEGMRQSDFQSVKEAFLSINPNPEYIILDEIQNINGWELFVSRLRETNKVIVTGSNATLMSDELATRLTGRYISFNVFPFSFEEFLSYNDFMPDVNLTKDISRTKELLDKYIKEGGFPETYLFGSRFAVQIYSDILSKDAEKRFNIRHKQSFRELSRYLVSNVAKEASYNNLSKILGIKSLNTVKKYFGFLEDTYLIFRLDKFSRRMKGQILGNKKVYCIDDGIVNMIGFRSEEEKGRLIENTVAVELMRRKQYWNITQELYYWQDYQHNEVDFVVKERSKVTQLIQVAYRISDPATKKRELSSLVKASKELKCNNLLLITWDAEGSEKYGGKKVMFIPLWKWLLKGSAP